MGARGEDVIEKIGHWYLNWRIIQKGRRGKKRERERESGMKKLDET